MTEKYKAKRSDSVLTPEIRWAYPWLFEKSTKRPNGMPRKVPVWIITGLLPKLNSDPMQCANYQFLSRLCLEACAREPQWGGQFPAGGHWPIQDGDAPPKPKPVPPGQQAAPVDPNKGAWRKGHWLIEASTSLDPGPRVCVMQNGVAIEIPAQTVNGRQMFKSGDHGHGSIHAYTFWNEKFGLNFGLEGVLWTREGEAIGSSGPRSAAQMFGSVAGTVAAAAPPAMPTAGAYPAPGMAPPPSPAPMPLQPQQQPLQQPLGAVPQQQYAPAPQAMPQVAAPPVAPVAPPLAPMAPAAGGMPLPPLPTR
jgi:hypothetical protein